MITKKKNKLKKKIENGFNKYFQFFSKIILVKKINAIIEINKSGRNDPLNITNGSPRRSNSEKWIDFFLRYNE